MRTRFVLRPVESCSSEARLILSCRRRSSLLDRLRDLTPLQLAQPTDERCGSVFAALLSAGRESVHSRQESERQERVREAEKGERPKGRSLRELTAELRPAARASKPMLRASE